ncbi:MAG TPA: helix-turn-helix domain-containing protein [Gemmatimonadales bacterium]|nr:helix-turn-helix domain-containing protein [Gemmatimonadales bacterium]
MTAPALPSLQIVRQPAQAQVLLHPERRRLIEALAAGPDSASGLARRLGESRQRLNYHLRLLEEAGQVELAEERWKGSKPERVMRLVARQYVLDPAAIGSLAGDPDQAGDRFSANYLVALASRTLRELAELLERARGKRARLATASVNTSVRVGSPAAFNKFQSDLARAVAQVVAKHHDEQGEGRWFRVIAGAYPGPRPPRGSEETAND